MGVAVILIVLAVVVCVPGVPGYVIAQRRGLKNPWVAFLPFFGLWIVLCESTGYSGFYSLVVLIPTLGAIVLSIWMAVEVPRRHGRSGWWTAALIVPGINLVTLWFYAFTLPQPPLLSLEAQS